MRWSVIGCGDSWSSTGGNMLLREQGTFLKGVPESAQGHAEGSAPWTVFLTMHFTFDFIFNVYNILEGCKLRLSLHSVACLFEHVTINLS